MNLNRRGIVGALVGAVAGGGAVIDGALKLGLAPTPPMHPSPESAGAALGQQAGRPSMERGRALKLLMGDANVLAELRAELYDQHQIINHVDADIAVLKSLSPMAKITFQRQRNVERALDGLKCERWDQPQFYIRSLESRLGKLMWGHS